MNGGGKLRSMRTSVAVLFALMFMVPGCLEPQLTTSEKEQGQTYTPLEDRYQLPFTTNGSYSLLLEPGPYVALDVQEVLIEVDTSSVWATGPSTAEVHLSYWLPNNTEEGVKVPIIAVVSPYFSYGQPGSESVATNVVSPGRGEFLFENFLPHGYGFAQVAVFGTEESSGCFDYRGAGEGLGIHSAVEWLGTQDWSNGRVGLYGKSYEGATQWEAAAQGSEFLKTIVPVSGTTALHPLLYKNGSAEARSQVMHMNYFSSTVDYNPDDADNICPDILEGILAGPVTYGAGEFDPYMSNYYEERSHIDKALGVYNGSIYWVQGLQDWNVDPHQVFGGPPGINWYKAYTDAGYDVKGMIGQWGHHYPDQINSHQQISSGYGAEAYPDMTRWDWAHDLFEWFEYYLMERGPKPELNVQIQRNDGQWRVESTWPPEGLTWSSTTLDECDASGSIVGGVSVAGGGIQTVTLDCPPVSDSDVHISGLATFHVTVHATFDGGQLFVELQDAETNLRLGHATMDIRYHAGGSEPQTVFPGQEIVMLMEFQGIDALLPGGHGLRLVVTETGEDYLAPACGLSCSIHLMTDASSTLSLPLTLSDESRVFQIPSAQEE